jgi:hypothetical protein
MYFDKGGCGNRPLELSSKEYGDTDACDGAVLEPSSTVELEIRFSMKLQDAVSVAIAGSPASG